MSQYYSSGAEISTVGEDSRKDIWPYHRGYGNSRGCFPTFVNVFGGLLGRSKSPSINDEDEPDCEIEFKFVLSEITEDDKTKSKITVQNAAVGSEDGNDITSLRSWIPIDLPRSKLQHYSENQRSLTPRKGIFNIFRIAPPESICSALFNHMSSWVHDQRPSPYELPPGYLIRPSTTSSNSSQEVQRHDPYDAPRCTEYPKKNRKQHTHLSPYDAPPLNPEAEIYKQIAYAFSPFNGDNKIIVNGHSRIVCRTLLQWKKAVVDEVIDASSVPKYLWREEECRDWLVGVICASNDELAHSEARELANKFNGDGSRLYRLSRSQWYKELGPGKEGKVVYNEIERRRRRWRAAMEEWKEFVLKGQADTCDSVFTVEWDDEVGGRGRRASVRSRWS